MSTDVRDVLIEARDKISDPKAWTKHHMAVNADGEYIYPYRLEAVAWCMDGALLAAVISRYEMREFNVRQALLESARTALWCVIGDDNDHITFNDDDSTTHEDVMLVFKHAIELVSE